MKMIPLLWRVVSVWLCVAVVCWCPSCHVGCTESQQEAQRPVSSQDVGTEEESGDKFHDHKDVESLVLPVQSLSEHEQLTEDDEQKEKQTAAEEDKKQPSEAVEVDEPAVDAEWEADAKTPPPEPEPEPSPDNQHQDTSITQEQDSDSQPPSPDPDPVSGSAAEHKDDPNIPNIQDSIPNSVSSEASDVVAPDAIDSDLLPTDCEEENNPYDGDSIPPIVLENTSNVHTTGTKTQPDPPLSSAAGHSTQHLEANTSQVMKEKDLSSPVTMDTDSSVSSKDPEDIPTFDEWKRKVMEVEKEKTQSAHTSNNGATHAVKKVQKNFNNYASVECGAKILGANSEAKSTSAILKENMDLYMLNPCSNKIWFIIELCEPIQVKQLDIANFELFSSTPKDFLVSISDRYPTNKWLKLGTFHARDERTVQSFPLDEHLYAKYVKMFTKYIKVELVSHFGSEHFCPLSLIRVFGTSMVEEYEEIADPSERPDDQDDDLDYLPGYTPGEVKLSRNLIGSAKDVILNMVNNIAVNVLGGGPEMQGNLSSQEVNMTEPSPQHDTGAETTTTNLTSVPDSEEEMVLPDPDIPATAAPSDPPVPETPTADPSTQELPPVEENVVLPVEEEHISSTITLLDEEEEELDEENEKRDQHMRQQEIQSYCSLLPSCSCVASLQEYLLRRCSALLSKRRKCQTTERKQILPPIQTPAWHQLLSPSACPELQQPHGEVRRPGEKEQASEQEPESGAGPSGAPPPLESAAASHTESLSEPPPLEPSQTSSLPKPSAADSSSAKPTPIVETSQLPSEVPEKSQDVPVEEKHVEPTASLGGGASMQPGVGVTVDNTSEEKSDADVTQPETPAPLQTPDKTDQSQGLHPTTSPYLDNHPDTPPAPGSGAASAEVAHLAADIVAALEPSSEAKTEDFPEDISASSPSHLAPPSSASLPSLSDIYAEPPNDTEQNGNPVHGSSQKESVFMRLNNRIKALEMNMSLSGRYLEQLSQRYRKQMEEMQKAFNKTIIKLQNTSRIAEEQDQRQTESIQLLQGQLENVTQLVLNLSVRVSQLQIEVSDRHNYLLLALLLCLCLGLLLCANHCRINTIPPTTEPEPPSAKSYTYCCPERPFSSCDETGLKRSASYPLIHSFQLATTEGPEMLHLDDIHSLCPANRKRRRRKMKSMETVETLRPSFHAAPELCNGGVVCNGGPVTTNPSPFTKRLLQPVFRDSPSEGSSEGSSHSDDPSFCGITTACSRICDGMPPPKTRAEKRASRRRRPKPDYGVVDLFQAPRRDRKEALPLPTISTIHDIMNRKTEQRSGTFGVNVALSGPV